MSASQKPAHSTQPGVKSTEKQEGTSGVVSRQWIWTSVLAAAAYGTSSFLIYVLNRRSGRFNSAAMNLAVYTVICILSFWLLGLQRAGQIGTAKTSIFNNLSGDIVKVMTTKQFLAFVLAIAATTVVGNIALYASYILAPNPGFCDVISSSSAFVTLLLGMMLFAQPAKAVNVAGMALLMLAWYLILA